MRMKARFGHDGGRRCCRDWDCPCDVGREHKEPKESVGRRMTADVDGTDRHGIPYASGNRLEVDEGGAVTLLVRMFHKYTSRTGFALYRWHPEHNVRGWERRGEMDGWERYSETAHGAWKGGQ